MRMPSRSAISSLSLDMTRMSPIDVVMDTPTAVRRHKVRISRDQALDYSSFYSTLAKYSLLRISTRASKILGVHPSGAIPSLEIPSIIPSKLKRKQEIPHTPSRRFLLASSCIWASRRSTSWSVSKFSLIVILSSNMVVITRAPHGISSSVEI